MKFEDQNRKICRPRNGSFKKVVFAKEGRVAASFLLINYFRCYNSKTDPANAKFAKDLTSTRCPSGPV